MDDHYKLLGLHRNASKEDIKKAFRKLALQFHPDKHSDSPAYVKSKATHQFKQLSEAYEILSDERKRSDYDIGLYSTRSSSTSSSSSSNNYSYNKNDYYQRRYTSYYGNRYAGASSNWGKRADLGLRLEIFCRYLTSQSFLLGSVACVLIGGAYAIDATRDSLWKMKNTGKSFEEAMDSLERAKAHKDKS